MGPIATPTSLCLPQCKLTRNLCSMAWGAAALDAVGVLLSAGRMLPVCIKPSCCSAAYAP